MKSLGIWRAGDFTYGPVLLGMPRWYIESLGTIFIRLMISYVYAFMPRMEPAGLLDKRRHSGFCSEDKLEPISRSRTPSTDDPVDV
jgi:hypothetical protein